MELENQIKNEINIEKNNFFNSIIGQTINNAIDIGLKKILPDLIENQIIEIKDALIQNGLNDGIQTAVDRGVDFGKSVVGIFTGNFENMTQVRMALADGGIIDTLSNVLDKVVEKTYEAGYINKSINNIIKQGKDILLDNVSKNITNELDEQNKAIEKLERYVSNWKEYYQNQDFKGMTKEYNKIQKQIKNIIPLEKIIKETREVETLHNLIKKNGQNFEISDLEQELVKNLAV